MIRMWGIKHLYTQGRIETGSQPGRQVGDFYQQAQNAVYSLIQEY